VCCSSLRRGELEYEAERRRAEGEVWSLVELAGLQPSTSGLAERGAVVVGADVALRGWLS